MATTTPSAAPATRGPDRPPERPWPRRRRGRASRRRWTGLLYLLPALVVYSFVVLVPLGQSVNYSLYRWDGVSVPTWVGLGNYADFLGDDQLTRALEHVAVLVVFFSLLPIALGLVSAALVSSSAIRGKGLVRSVLFLPQVITSVVIAVVWKRLYEPDGPLNEALRAAGLSGLAQSWLGDPSWALPSLGVIGTWVTTGLCTVLFVAGVHAIPGELYDAAEVDGAGPLRRFTAVTLPGLRGQLAIALTLTVTAALRTFDLVWLTTQGGPGTSTVTPAVLLYRRAFANPDVGAAAAIGVVMAAFCLAVALLVQRVADREGV